MAADTAERAFTGSSRENTRARRAVRAASSAGAGTGCDSVSPAGSAATAAGGAALRPAMGAVGACPWAASPSNDAPPRESSSESVVSARRTVFLRTMVS